MSFRTAFSSFLALFTLATSAALAQPKIVSMAVGGNYTLAVADDGTVWAWGENWHYRLGQDYVFSQHTPEQVPGLRNIVAVAVGESTSVALSSDGTVWVWGGIKRDDAQGTRIDGNQILPTQVNGLEDIVAISNDVDQIVALARDGTVWLMRQAMTCTAAGACYAAPGALRPVRNLSDVVAIATGYHFSIALKRDGTVWGWGRWLGNVFHADYGDDFAFAHQIAGFSDVVHIATAEGTPDGTRVAAVKSDGSVWLVSNLYAAGFPTSPSGIPEQVPGISDARAIDLSEFHALVSTGDGSIWGWGQGYTGELGPSVDLSAYLPVRLSGLAPAAALWTGGQRSYALLADQTVVGWGQGTYLGTVESLDAIQHVNPDPRPVLDLRNRDVAPGAVDFTKWWAGDGEALFFFEGHRNGGAPAEIQVDCVSRETATTVSAVGTTSPISVVTLVNGQTYDCTSFAVNAVGPGPVVNDADNPMVLAPHEAQYLTLDSPLKISTTEGIGTLPLTIRRTGNLSDEVTVHYLIGPMASQSYPGEDYVQVTGLVTFAPGVESAQVGLQVLDGNQSEVAERVFVRIFDASPGVEIGPVDEVEVRIADNDELRVDLSTTTPTIAEGGQAVVTVTRSGNDMRALTVPWTAIPTSAATDDISTLSGSVTLAEGATTATIRVPTVNDQAVEGDEVFYITLGEIQGERITSQAQAVKITMTDNDSLVRLSEPTVSVSENGTQVVLTVTRTGFLGSTATVRWSANNGTALAGTDYGTRGTTTLSGSVTLAPNVASADIVIPILNNTTIGSDVTFSVALASVSGSIVDSEAKTATVTIVEDDQGIQLDSTAQSVAEGAGSVALLVKRVGPPTGEVSATWTTANSTAQAGSQFGSSGNTAQLSGTLVWAAGDSNPKTIIVPIIDDGATNNNRVFTVTLTAVTGAAFGANRRTVVTITDDDNTVQFNVATRAVAENAGNVVLTVTRLGGAADAASVQWRTANGTAIAGTDYGTAADPALLGGVLNWAANDKANKSITIPIINNTAVAGGERTFTIELYAPAGATIGTVATTVASITDDDKGVAMASASYEVTEGAASAIAIVVNRMGSASQALSVPWSTANGTALAGTQFGTRNNTSQRAGTLSWAAGDATPKNITVPILNNTDSHGDTQFTVALGNVPSGFIKGEPNVATVTIHDDDLPPESRVAFAAAKTLVAEGPGASAALALNRTVHPGCGGCDLSREVSVKFSTVAGTALAGSDYVAATNATVTFAPFESNKTIQIALTDNNVIEAPESFRVKLLSPSPGLVLGERAETTVAIQDDDEQFPPHGTWPEGWTVPMALGADAETGWHLSTDPGAVEGFTSLRSDTIFDGEQALLDTPLQSYAAGKVQFRFRVSSEADFDWLRFYLCNAANECTKLGEWSGQANETTWGTASITVPQGTHKFRWAYEKDDSFSVGFDSAWIDAVTLPAVQ